eukprot:5589480-Ditylum_brightwellii.AAC.1
MVHALDCVGTDGTVLCNGVDKGAEGAEKHIVHLSQAADCRQAKISEQKEHLVSNEDDDADNGDVNGDDDSVGNGADDGADDGAEGAKKHLTHVSQVADCCLADRSKQNKHLVWDKDEDVDNFADD